MILLLNFTFEEKLIMKRIFFSMMVLMFGFANVHAQQNTTFNFAEMMKIRRVGDPQQADYIFKHGIVPIESAGDPNAVSPTGAIPLREMQP